MFAVAGDETVIGAQTNTRDPLPRQPMVGIALAAISGIALADYFPQSRTVVIAAVLVMAAFAILLRRSLMTCVFVATSFFAVHNIRQSESSGRDLARQIGGETRAITARGFIRNEPRISPAGTATFQVALTSVELEEQTLLTHAKLLVHWKYPVEYGDEVTVFGATAPIPPPRNPGEFDMRGQLARQGIYRQLTVGYKENGTVLQHGGGNIILRAAQHSRRWLQQVLSRGLEDSPDVVSMMNGMVLGLRHQTAEDIEEPFQQTGTLHLFAVAGLHVGIVAQLLWILGAVARLPRKWATAVVIPALFFYAAVTGLHTSSVRAAAMSAVLLSGFFVERKVFALNSLAAAAVLILAWNTNELFAIGFQLSFAVVGTIILVTEPTFRFLRRQFEHDPFLPRSLFSRTRRAIDRVIWWVARAASVSFAAWLGSLPLMFYYYHLVTPISLVANLAVVPVAFFVLAGALVSVICAPFSAWLSVVFNNTNWLLGRIILGLVHVFAQLPDGHFYAEHPHPPSGALLEITALDLGTGAALHLRAGHRDWLVDCGAKRDFDRTLRPYLRSRGVNRLDGLLLTHGDAGHIGAAIDVLDVFAPRALVDTAAPDRSTVHRQLLDQLGSRRVEHRIVSSGESLSFPDGIVGRVLFPPHEFAADAADDRAVVMQLCVNSRPRVLLMSDAGEPTEAALLASGQNLQSDIMIKGQHRSGVSGSPQFIDAVKPQLIIATSRDFPETERIKDAWVKMLDTHGIRLLRQDETGAVRVRIFRNGWEARPYLSGETLRNTVR